jgi:glycosyltransferase involved in cell wall biosynthesis
VGLRLLAMSIEIIVKTCDGESIHGKNVDRYCGATKPELIYKCLCSVIQSANNFKDNCLLTVIDDGSSSATIKMIQDLLSFSDHESRLIQRKKNDYNQATLEFFSLAKASQKEFVYCVEDDYLHHPYAINELYQFAKLANAKVGKQIILHPFDDPDNYREKYIKPAYIVTGKKCHWRTNNYTTCTFFTKPQVIIDNWHHFENFALYYGVYPTVNEDSTLNLVWASNDNQLFTPLPSLALHMQFEVNRDTVTDWKSLWDQIPEYK